MKTVVVCGVVNFVYIERRIVDQLLLCFSHSSRIQNKTSCVTHRDEIRLIFETCVNSCQ